MGRGLGSKPEQGRALHFCTNFHMIIACAIRIVDEVFAINKFRVRIHMTSSCCSISGFHNTLRYDYGPETRLDYKYLKESRCDL